MKCKLSARPGRMTRRPSMAVKMSWRFAWRFRSDPSRLRKTLMDWKHHGALKSRNAKNPLKTRIFRRKTGAEGEGFEPSNTFVLPVFKTGAIGRSAIPPGTQIIRQFGRFFQCVHALRKVGRFRPKSTCAYQSP